MCLRNGCWDADPFLDLVGVVFRRGVQGVQQTQSTRVARSTAIQPHNPVTAKAGASPFVVPRGFQCGDYCCHARVVPADSWWHVYGDLVWSGNYSDVVNKADRQRAVVTSGVSELLACRYVPSGGCCMQQLPIAAPCCARWRFKVHDALVGLLLPHQLATVDSSRHPTIIAARICPVGERHLAECTHLVARLAGVPASTGQSARHGGDVPLSGGAVIEKARGNGWTVERAEVCCYARVTKTIDGRLTYLAWDGQWDAPDYIIYGVLDRSYFGGRIKRDDVAE